LAPAPRRIRQGSSSLLVDLGQGSSPSACRPNTSQLATGGRAERERDEVVTPIHPPQLALIRPLSLRSGLDLELCGDLDLRLRIRPPQLVPIRSSSLCDGLDLRLQIRPQVGLLPPHQPPPGPQEVEEACCPVPPLSAPPLFLAPSAAGRGGRRRICVLRVAPLLGADPRSSSQKKRPAGRRRPPPSALPASVRVTRRGGRLDSRWMQRRERFPGLRDEGGGTAFCSRGCSSHSLLSYGPPWAHYLGGYQDRLLDGPLGLLGLCHMAPDGVGRKDYGGGVLE
jgi:hypothetical protein